MDLNYFYGFKVADSDSVAPSCGRLKQVIVDSQEPKVFLVKISVTFPAMPFGW